MNARRFCSQVMVVVGLLAMQAGSFDPLEGSLFDPPRQRPGCAGRSGHPMWWLTVTWLRPTLLAG